MKSKKIKVVTRKSRLALIQPEIVLKLLPKNINFDIIKLKSLGDKDKNIKLTENKDQDIFTRELDNYLLGNKADIAIHSAKDLPLPLKEGLEVIALLEAEDKTDSLVSRNNLDLFSLPKGSLIGTSSYSRRKQLLKYRPDIRAVPIRGTIEERIKLVDDGVLSGVITASCALERLGLEKRISQVLSFETHPLQGNIAVVARKNRSDLRRIFNRIDTRKNYGKVYLVGFGPGSPDLLTIKAHKILKKAGIIYHDDLLDKNYLKKYKAKKVYVGKRRNRHQFKQDEINKMLYESAVRGNTVVRLKGGDSLIFGRGGEELNYLEERLVDVEVIPGISSAIAAFKDLKIPLTQRGISSSAAFCSGAYENNIQVPNADTLVYFMGAVNLKKIINNVLAKGWNPDTPLAIVSNVSMPYQKIKISTLNNEVKTKEVYPSPLLLIIGNIVGQKINLTKYLNRKNILFTGTNPEKFKRLGNIIHNPFIEILPVRDYKKIDKEIRQLKKYDFIIFTSRYSVSYFFSRLNKILKDSRCLKDNKIISIGSATAYELLKYGIMPDYQPDLSSSKGIIELFKKHRFKKKNILIPRSNIARPYLPKRLKELGNKVKTLIVYKNKKPKNVARIDLSSIDEIIFTSPSCVKNFGSVYKKMPSYISLLAIGEETLKEINKRYKNAEAKII